MPSFRATLEEAGYEVVTASTGPAAMACMEKHDIGLAVLDVLMPGIRATRSPSACGGRIPDLPVLLMTGSARVRHRERAPVLTKPFPQEELVAAVRR